jgi:hypothetical protein
MTSSRRSLERTAVVTGFLPGGSSSMTEVSRPA